MAQGSEIGTGYLLIKPKTDSSFADEIGGVGSTAGGLFNSKFGGILKKLPGVMASLGIGKAIGDFMADSINVGMDFDKAMSQVAATMGKSVDEIQDLRDFAKEMGAATAFSATESAEALNYMALAGYDTATSMEMLPNVLNLAAAGSIDLARASDMVTDAQSALGLSTEQTTAMVDIMAKAASTTNTSVEQLGDAFLTVGGTAKMMQGGTAELAQVLGLLADNGIKGAEGGTAMRNMLLALSAPTDAARKQMEALGLNVFDAQGNMRSMQDIIGDLNAAMADMTDEEKVNAISNIFNARDLKSVNALLGTSAERWEEVAGAIGDAEGAAGKMADTQLDNLSGDLTLMQSAWEGMQISISELVMPALRVFAQFATTAIQNVTNFIHENQGAFDALGAALSVVAQVVTGVLGGAFTLLGGIISGLGQAVKDLQTIFTTLADAVKGAFDTVVSVVTGAINTIKNLFNFKFELPHIPLPHFAVNPPGWQLGDLLKGQLPSLGIEWYAKGGIVDGATLIGAGEAGPEAIVPLTAPNIAPFADAVASRVGRSSIYIENMNVEADDVDELILSINRRLAELGAM